MYSKTQNSSKLLLKVPTNISVPVGTLHLYSAYLWFKQFNRFGVIRKSSIPREFRNRANYWLKKLVSCGFITPEGDHYRLKSYQSVWRQMKIKKSRTKSGIYKFKYWIIKVDSQKSFLKDVKDGVFKHLVERRKNQIAFRLAFNNPNKVKSHRRKGTVVELSAKVASKLFGYSKYSWSSGLKARDKYFKVTRGIKYTYLDFRGVETTRFECGKVSLF
jgi:hypothetical protein